MLESSVRLLTSILDTDESLPAHIRQLLIDLREGKSFDHHQTLPPDDLRLINVKEAALRLNCSRSSFYEERKLYTELTPVPFGGRVGYNLALVGQLVTRLTAAAIQQRMHEGKDVVRHVA